MCNVIFYVKYQITIVKINIVGLNGNILIFDYRFLFQFTIQIIINKLFDTDIVVYQNDNK